MKDKAAAAVEFLIWFLIFFCALRCGMKADAQTVPLPNHAKTPGMVDPSLTTAKLCNPQFHTASVRHVPESEKRKVCAEYGITSGCPGPGYELDHLISIELGGSNDIRNLWPQAVDSPGVIGFHTKDKLENRLHRMVCSGKMSLKDAQTCIAGNWYKCMAHVNSQ